MTVVPFRFRNASTASNRQPEGGRAWRQAQGAATSFTTTPNTASRAAGTPALEAANPPAVWGGDVSPALLRPVANGPTAGSTVRVFTGAQKVEEIRFR